MFYTTSGPSNVDRAAWAGEAISVFRVATGTDHQDVLADLLCDLMHWADAHGFNFDRELERGRSHYDAELQDEVQP